MSTQRDIWPLYFCYFLKTGFVDTVPFLLQTIDIHKVCQINAVDGCINKFL